MKWILRASALGVWCALMLGLSGAGCSSEPNCRPGTKEVIDNRDRKYPDFDVDWICLGVWSGESNPSNADPDVSGSWPIDPPGPKDPDAVVKLAILLDSCSTRYHDLWPGLNWSINAIYFEQLRDATTQAFFDRASCVKDKANGCEALRECYGFVQRIREQPGATTESTEPLVPFGCPNGVKTNTGIYPVAADDRVVFSSTWVNCKGLGLECFEDVTSGWCSRPRIECDPNASQSSCLDGRIYKCADPDGDGIYEYEQKPACSDFGLVCEDEWQDNMGWTDCIGAGASCIAYDVDYLREDRAMFTLKYGTKCESATQMRGCIRTNESPIDCAQIGKGFTCLPWNGIAECGFASECDSSDPVACDGDSIVVCDAGRKRKVNCKDLGFNTCDPKLVACGPTDLAIFPR